MRAVALVLNEDGASEMKVLLALFITGPHLQPPPVS
jgi:hypothetical protein